MYNSDIIVTAAFSLRNGEVLDWQRLENNIMSKMRVAIEWTFGTIIMLFKFIAFVHTQKLFQAPLAKEYVAAVFFANCHMCIYGAVPHSEYFDIDPPSLADYLDQ
jgi:uncharacterized PurR-regulated membrane protein YhhQ (DUF165 family)